MTGRLGVPLLGGRSTTETPLRGAGGAQRGLRTSGSAAADTADEQRRNDTSSALRRTGLDGSMRMRRARYLAGEDALTRAKTARDCLCGPAIPTRTCAPARQAGPSTNDCRDHQAPIFAVWRTPSPPGAGSGRSSEGERSWLNGSGKNARLRRQDKNWGQRHGLSGHVNSTGLFRAVALAVALPLSALVHNWTLCSFWPLRVRVANSFGVRPPISRRGDRFQPRPCQRAFPDLAVHQSIAAIRLRPVATLQTSHKLTVAGPRPRMRGHQLHVTRLARRRT